MSGWEARARHYVIIFWIYRKTLLHYALANIIQFARLDSVFRHRFEHPPELAKSRCADLCSSICFRTGVLINSDSVQSINRDGAKHKLLFSLPTRRKVPFLSFTSVDSLKTLRNTLFSFDFPLSIAGEHQQYVDVAAARLQRVLSILSWQNIVVRGRCRLSIPPRESSDR